jgi:hypothetical protein
MTTKRSDDPIAPPALAAVLWLLCAGIVLPAPPAAGGQDPAPEAGASAAEEPAAEPETYDNTIRWATASEVDNFGFDVFRSESEDGPFEKLNDRVIEGAGTSDEPQRYQFVDDTIDPRKTYYYYVESISMSGTRERFTPVGKAKPKIPPEDEGAEEEAEPSEDGDG